MAHVNIDAREDVNARRSLAQPIPMSAQPDLLVIFARAPRAGSVKTRLVPLFTPVEACDLHVALIGDVLDRARRALGSRASIELSWSEPTDAAAVLGAIPGGVTTTLQPCGDLGERMALTIQGALRAGRRRVVVLGSDAPTLPDDHLGAAFEALATHEVVIGPAEDGGYYLVGMSRLHLEIFRGVRWGTDEVLRVTRLRLRKSGISYAELGPWHDVDTAQDVARLWKELIHFKQMHSPELPPRTWRLLSRLAPGRLPARE